MWSAKFDSSIVGKEATYDRQDLRPGGRASAKCGMHAAARI
jgi:hypothetical protein